MNNRILAAPALALLLGACTVDNNASVAWGPICYPSDDCKFESTCGLQYIGPYEFMPGAGSLHLFMQVNNQRADNSDATSGRVNTANAYIRSIEVEYSNGLATTATPVSEQVPAAGTAVIWVEIPLPGVVAGQRVIASVRLSGVYGDESEFDTAALEVPINVCDASTCLYAARACATANSGCPVDVGQSPHACGG